MYVWMTFLSDESFAGNVGLSRDFDQRWVTQYGALFCVLNNLGQVVTWRLTSSVSFSNTEVQMLAMKQRLEKLGKRVKEFYIDNCCAWRKKLQNLFGQEMKVYLDIFHAVQRVAKKIPKRHRLRYECMEEFRLVFRQPTDLGKNRTKATPETEVIQSNMDRFVERWKNAECQGNKVLSKSALKEIDNLRIHVQKGCLSGIKPGRGTNRNEELHKDLNKIFSSSRYGVELAYTHYSQHVFTDTMRKYPHGKARGQNIQLMNINILSLMKMKHQKKCLDCHLDR